MSTVAPGVPLLAVRDLHVVYRRGQSRHSAVEGVSLEVHRGETVALIGESGAGKSTVARAVLGLLRPTSGKIEILGQDVGAIGRRQEAALRSRVQAVLQNPYGSLDPRWRVGRIVAEPMWSARRRGHGELDRHQIAARVREMLAGVGLDPETAHARPAALSGGERQRVAIARALSVRPAALVADEPVTALDNTTRRQIVGLLRQIGSGSEMGVLLISHSMSLVAELADRVYVITGGQIVEEGPVDQVMGDPRHEYTARLLRASQVLDAWSDPLPAPAISSSRAPGTHRTL